MGRRVNTYDYLAPNLKRQDMTGEMKTFMTAIDVALDEVTDSTLVTTWDIEKAPREELETMAKSIGLFPENFMKDDVLRKYIRSSGRIRELKGTDTLIEYLVDTLTRFKVYEIVLDETNARKIDVKLYYGTQKDFDYQQRILDFLIAKYKKLIYEYGVTYVSISSVTWANPMYTAPTTTKMRHTQVLDNFSDMVVTSTTKMNVTSNTVMSGDVMNGDTYKTPFQLVTFR